MSYARLADPGSDVYVYRCERWLHCCWCVLSGTDPHLESTAEMLAHLEAHRKAGHGVPDYCIDRLKEDGESNDREMAVARKTHAWWRLAREKLRVAHEALKEATLAHPSSRDTAHPAWEAIQHARATCMVAERLLETEEVK